MWKDLVSLVVDNKSEWNHSIIDDVAIGKFLNSKGIRWYYTQANNKYWPHNTLQYYLVARMLWNPNQDFNALLDDYFDKMYGAAGPSLKEFYLTIEDSVQQSDWVAGPYPYKAIIEVSDKAYTPAVKSKCRDLLENAEKAELAPCERKRLKTVRETFDYISK